MNGDLLFSIIGYVDDELIERIPIDNYKKTRAKTGMDSEYNGTKNTSQTKRKRPRRRIFGITVLFLVFVIVFAGCRTAHLSENEENKNEIDHLLDEEETLMQGAPFPEYFLGWGLPEDTIVYSGEELVVPYHVNNGNFDVELDFCVALDGIFQTIAIEENGTRTPYDERIRMKFKAQENREFNICFSPNVGKTGDVFELSVGHFFFNSYLVTEETPVKSYGTYHCFRDTICKKLLMNADSPGVISDKTISHTATTPIDKRLYSFFSDVENDIKWTDSLVQVIYRTKDELFTEEGYLKNTIHLNPGSTATIYLELGGKPGKYRTSFYLDHKQQPFDAQSLYLDVEIKDSEDILIPIQLSIENLRGYHHVYAITRPLEETFDSLNVSIKTDSQILIIE